MVTLSFAATKQATAQRPNILFILTDDQSRSSLSCYGGPVPTPHLDKLAAEGIQFHDAYVMPQCTPTRAALLTGQHTAKNGMWHVIPWYGTPFAPITEPAFREELLPEQSRLPRLLRDLGYATGMAGKWHVTHNAQQGFYTYLRQQASQQFGFDYVAPPGPGSQNEGDKWVDHLTDCTIDFIQSHEDEPWFFYLSHHTLHGRVSAPKHLIDQQLEQGAPVSGLGNATYRAAIIHLDNSIGRLLKALESTENTIVVFLSDNGGVDTQFNLPQWENRPLDGSLPLTIKSQQFESAPLRAGKGSVYEGGIRVPCLVKWEERIEPRECHTPVHIVDWLPTLLELAAASKHTEDKFDGQSLAPLLVGDASVVLRNELAQRSLYWYLPLYDLRWAATPCAAVRQGDWKLIEYFGDWYDAEGNYHLGHHVELYNLAQDLGETNNCVSRHPDVAQRLQADLHEWIVEQGAPIPTRNPNQAPSRWLLETKEKPAFFVPYAKDRPAG